MRHRAVFAIVFGFGILALSLVLATPVYACVIGPRLSPREEVKWKYDDAETVFVGRLLTDTIDTTDSRHRHIVTFEVLTSLKGAPVSPLMLRANESDSLPEGDCPNLAQDLRAGDSYLVFAFRSSSTDPTLFTNSLYSPLLDSADGRFAMSVIAHSHANPRFVGMPTAGEEWNIAVPATIALMLCAVGFVFRNYASGKRQCL